MSGTRCWLGVPGGAVVAAALVACSLAPSATPTVPPPTTPPPLLAGPVADWDGKVITTVCLTVDEEYVGAPDMHPPVKEWLRSILEPVGVTLTEPGAQCDADLAVTTLIRPLSATYTSGTYYTGSDRQVNLSLTTVGQRQLTYHAEETVTPPTVVYGEWATTAAEYVDRLSWYPAGHLLRSATRIWGPAVAVEALRSLPTDWPSLDPGMDSDDLLPESILRTGAADNGPPESAGGNDPLETYLGWRNWLEAQPPPDGRPVPSRTSETAPIPLGEVGVAADGWSIRITEVAIDTVADMPNRRQVSVALDATWNGFGRADTGEIGRIGFFTPTVGEPGPCFVPHIPYWDSDADREAFEGETVSGWANCGIVPRDSADTLKAWYEPTATSVYDPSAEADERVWFALR